MSGGKTCKEYADNGYVIGFETHTAESYNIKEGSSVIFAKANKI